MNPNIWGPPLWKIMTDVAYRADRVKDTRMLPYVPRFYESLAFLLPCKWCRHSYRKYIIELNVWEYHKQRKLVEWIWRLKEKVNDKLKKPDCARLDLNMFLRRINLYTHSSSVDYVFDFLSIIGLNYDPQDDRVKQKHMLIFHTVLPVVLPFTRLNEVLGRHPLRIENLQTRNDYLDWLYKVRQLYVKQQQLPPLPPASELWKRYSNARAEQKLPVYCQYILDDRSTWETMQSCVKIES